MEKTPSADFKAKATGRALPLAKIVENGSLHIGKNHDQHFMFWARETKLNESQYLIYRNDAELKAFLANKKGVGWIWVGPFCLITPMIRSVWLNGRHYGVCISGSRPQNDLFKLESLRSLVVHFWPGLDKSAFGSLDHFFELYAKLKSARHVLRVDGLRPSSPTLVDLQTFQTLPLTSPLKSSL